MSSNSMETYTDLNKIATSLREKLENKKCILLFAHNHVGKTRLSMEFKNIGKKENGTPDTLYFNSFTGMVLCPSAIHRADSRCALPEKRRRTKRTATMI